MERRAKVVKHTASKSAVRPVRVKNWEVFLGEGTLGIEPKALGMLSIHSTTELHPQHLEQVSEGMKGEKF